MFRLLVLLLFSPIVLQAQDFAETKPIATFWSKNDSCWVLVTLFEKCEIKTYFFTAPPETGVGISQDKLPILQEFYLYSNKQVLTCRDCRYLQQLDGTKSWGFTYDGRFIIDGKAYTNLSVIMSEKPEFDAFYICSEAEQPK